MEPELLVDNLVNCVKENSKKGCIYCHIYNVLDYFKNMEFLKPDGERMFEAFCNKYGGGKNGR